MALTTGLGAAFTTGLGAGLARATGVRAARATGLGAGLARATGLGAALTTGLGAGLARATGLGAGLGAALGVMRWVDMMGLALGLVTGCVPSPTRFAGAAVTLEVPSDEGGLAYVMGAALTPSAAAAS